MSEKAKLGKKLQVRGVLRELLRAELLDPENRKLIRQRLQAELRDAKSDLVLFRALLSAGLEPEAALKPVPAAAQVTVSLATVLPDRPVTGGAGPEVTGQVVRPALEPSEPEEAEAEGSVVPLRPPKPAGGVRFWKDLT